MSKCVSSKVILLGIFACLLTVFLYGCGTQEDIYLIEQHVDKSNANMFDNDIFFSEFKYIYLSETYNEGFYLYGTTDESANRFQIYNCNLKSMESNVIDYEVSIERPILSLSAGKGSHLWIMEYDKNDGTDSYEIKLIDGNDVTLFRHEKITDSFPSNLFVDEEEELVYIQSIDLQNGQIGYLYIYSLMGNSIAKIRLHSSSDIINLIHGCLFVLENESGDATIKVLDEKNYSLSEIQRIKNTKLNMISAGDAPDKLFLINDEGLSCINMEGIEMWPIVNWVANGLAGKVRYVIPNNNEYIIIMRDIDNFDKIVRLAKTEKKSEKAVLTLATIDSDRTVSLAVANYNSSHTSCVIEIKDYSVYEENAIRQLNIDLITGGIDLIHLDGLQIDNYISSGALEDLSPYLESSILLSQLWEPALSSLYHNRSCYVVSPVFRLLTICGRKTSIDKIKGYNFCELLEYIDGAKTEDNNIFGNEMTKEEFISLMVSCNLYEFVDYQTDKASFSSNEFITLLNTAKRMIPKDDLYDSFVRLYEGKQELSFQSIRGFVDVDSLLSIYGDQLAMYAPNSTKENNQSAIMVPIYSFGMTSTTKNKGNAWEFLEWLYSQEFQDNLPLSIGVPMNKETFEKQWSIIINGFSDESLPTGYTYVYYNGDQYVGIEISYAEDRAISYDLLVDLINGIDRIYQYDYTITEIINDNLSSFFEDGKTAEEVATVINSKVAIYLAEQS